MDLWLFTWEAWRPHISTWLGNIEETDLHHLGRLRIPSSLVEHILAEEKHRMRWRVAWHQYHMLLGVINVARSLQGLPIYLWVGAMRAGRLSKSVAWHCVVFVYAKPIA